MIPPPPWPGIFRFSASVGWSSMDRIPMTEPVRCPAARRGRCRVRPDSRRPRDGRVRPWAARTAGCRPLRGSRSDLDRAGWPWPPAGPGRQPRRPAVRRVVVVIVRPPGRSGPVGAEQDRRRSCGSAGRADAVRADPGGQGRCVLVKESSGARPSKAGPGGGVLRQGLRVGRAAGQEPAPTVVSTARARRDIARSRRAGPSAPSPTTAKRFNESGDSAGLLFEVTGSAGWCRARQHVVNSMSSMAVRAYG